MHNVPGMSFRDADYQNWEIVCSNGSAAPPQSMKLVATFSRPIAVRSRVIFKRVSAGTRDTPVVHHKDTRAGRDSAESLEDRVCLRRRPGEVARDDRQKAARRAASLPQLRARSGA